MPLPMENAVRRALFRRRDTGCLLYTSSRMILQSVEALRKNGIQAMVRRSNGKRVIELHRADSADLEGAGEIVPIDPVEALCGNLRAVSRCGE